MRTFLKAISKIEIAFDFIKYTFIINLQIIILTILLFTRINLIEIYIFSFFDSINGSTCTIALYTSSNLAIEFSNLSASL